MLVKDKIVKKPLNDYEYIVELSEDYVKEKNNKLYQMRLEKSQIPERYWDLELDMYQGEKSIDSLNKVHQYIDKMNEHKFRHVNLFMYGAKNGTQKTLCATNIGKAFIKNGNRVKFIYAGELINTLLKNQGFSYIQDIENKIQELLFMDLLIIDDFGDKEKSVYWENNPQLIRTAWDTFLRRAISENVRIIMTSNKSFDSIKDMLGDSLYELLKRNFVLLPFNDSIGDYVTKLKFDDLWS